MEEQVTTHLTASEEDFGLVVIFQFQNIIKSKLSYIVRVG